MKVDYEKKSRLLKTDYPRRVNAIEKRTYINALEGVIFDQELEYDHFELLNEIGLETYQECIKINKNGYDRSKRLRKRINGMLVSDCVWCTFTFTNKVLKETNLETRRQYVRRYLNSFGCPYIANIDYGSNNEYISRNKQVKKGTEREHYHALIQRDKLPMKWQYGHEWLEHVRVEGSTDRKISKYLSKLTNHAIKESAKRCSIIYSRLK